jgi:hypothetical protein
MAVNRRLLVAVLPLCVATASAAAQGAPSWDGIWTGVEAQADAAPIQIAIAGGKVVSYTFEGAPFVVSFSKITPTSVSFGDRDHYFVKLNRTGATTASGQFHDRSGAGALRLTKEERASRVDRRRPAPAAPRNP